MKYILMMTATKAEFDWYASWSKEDLQANFTFMRAFSKELKDSGVFVAAEGLALHVLPSRIDSGFGDCADVAGGGRLDHSGDRPRVSCARAPSGTSARLRARQGASRSTTTFSRRPRDSRANCD